MNGSFQNRTRRSTLASRNGKRVRMVLAGVLAAAVGGALTGETRATSYYWDINGATANVAGAVTGTWDGINAFWNDASTGTGGTPVAVTSSADDLFFSSGTVYTTGTVTIAGTPAASSITFNAGQNIILTLSGGTSLTLGGTGVNSGILILTGNTTAKTISTPIILNAASTALAFTNSGTSSLTLGTVTGSAASGTQTITVTGTTTFGGVVADGGAGGKVALSVTSATTLSAVNTFTGGLTLRSGTVSYLPTAIGSGTLTLGDTTGSAGVQFDANGTYANPITIAGGNTGGMTIHAEGTTILQGLITLNGHDLTLLSNNKNRALTLTGGTAGTGNLTLSIPAGTAQPIALTTTSINHTGSITNTGNQAVTNTISAPIGTNVTNIVHSATGGLVFSSATVANNGNITFSGNGAGTVNFSAADINNTGTITNNGTTTGTTTIGGAIGTNVTGVVQNSTTSRLVLSGANTYTSATTVTAGRMQVTGTGTLAGTSNLSVGANARFDYLPASAGTLTLGGTLTLASKQCHRDDFRLHHRGARRRHGGRGREPLSHGRIHRWHSLHADFGCERP